MTLAICLKCGARKIGALVPCVSCGYEPKEEQDKAKSVLLSDHNLSKEALVEMAERIKSGQPVTFDEGSVQSFVEAVRVAEQERPFGGPWAAWLTCGIVIVLGCLLGLLLMAVST
jgi:hypothetical protein